MERETILSDSPDTWNVHSSLALVISKEPQFRKMCETIGMFWLGRDGDRIVFKAGPQSVEIGSGNTVRQALEAALLHWKTPFKKERFGNMSTERSLAVSRAGQLTQPLKRH